MIVLNNVEKKYPGFTLHINMEIPAGTITGLVGKNGAGKSTTIKCILNLIKPDSGQILLFGKNLDELKIVDKEQMGVCLSESGFCQELNVYDVQKILKKMYKKFDEEYFVQKCQKLELPLNKKIRDFSTGMKAKLKVLVAISHQANLLILDEPTSGLDVEARMEVLDILREYIQEEDTRSILITSHISSDLENLCDNIYLIHKGQVILKEDTDVILDQYGLLKVSEEQFRNMDQEYILNSQHTNYGYVCFTNQRQFYQENYPEIIVEKSGIDNLILMMTGGIR